MKTQEQTKQALNLNCVADKQRNKARSMRENIMYFAWCCELLCFILAGFFMGLSAVIFSLFFKLIAFVFFIIGMYLALDVGLKIQTNAIINYKEKNDKN